MHILIAMRVVMSMIVTMMVMTVLEAEDSDQVDRESSNADSEQFTDAMHLAARR